MPDHDAMRDRTVGEFVSYDMRSTAPSVDRKAPIPSAPLELAADPRPAF